MERVSVAAWCARFLAVPLIAALVGAAEPEMKGWETVRHEDRDYVAAASIHKFYRFNSLDGKDMSFRSSALVMKASIGSRDLLINNIKFVLSDPVVELEGKPCFSRLDVSKLIDPVLRPSRITGDTFDTVIIDPAHGGKDTGESGIHGDEKDFALNWLLLWRPILRSGG